MMYHNRPDGPPALTIRPSLLGDAGALRRLAQRDTRAFPEGELLVAVVDGEPRAAISLASGEVIADPFHPTQELVRMLALQRTRLTRGPNGNLRGGWLRWLDGRLAGATNARPCR